MRDDRGGSRKGATGGGSGRAGWLDGQRFEMVSGLRVPHGIVGL